MNDKPCPLCGREMTAIETHAGRGELYCVHCDLTIGGNEAKTPDELTELLRQRTCHEVVDESVSWYATICSECGFTLAVEQYGPINYCPNCGRRVVS